MKPEPQEPVITRSASATRDESVETHPAYGQIGASRVASGGGDVLYGSDFRHHHYVWITIHRSELHRTLSHDWPYATQEIIRVALSEAQWARFVSATNTGDMAQCTLDHVEGEQIPPIAYPTDRTAQFTDELRRDLDHALAALRALRTKVGDAKLSATARTALLDEVARAEMAITDAAPFVAKSFDQHVERTTERARVEINAHLNATIQRAGLAALGAQPPFELPEETK